MLQNEVAPRMSPRTPANVAEECSHSRGKIHISIGKQAVNKIGYVEQEKGTACVDHNHDPQYLNSTPSNL